MGSFINVIIYSGLSGEESITHTHQQTHDTIRMDQHNLKSNRIQSSKLNRDAIAREIKSEICCFIIIIAINLLNTTANK